MLRLKASCISLIRDLCSQLKASLSDATDLNDDAVAEGGVGIDVADLGLAVAKVQLHDALVDLLLAVDLVRK